MGNTRIKKGCVELENMLTNNEYKAYWPDQIGSSSASRPSLRGQETFTPGTCTTPGITGLEKRRFFRIRVRVFSKSGSVWADSGTPRLPEWVQTTKSEDASRSFRAPGTSRSWRTIPNGGVREVPEEWKSVWKQRWTPDSTISWAILFWISIRTSHRD